MNQGNVGSLPGNTTPAYCCHINTIKGGTCHEFGSLVPGITATKEIYRNLPVAILTEKALARGEGTLSNTGALVVKTGKYTGRSANDKFIVDTPAVHDEIAWGKVNRPIAKARFDAILAKVCAYLQGREIFIFDGFAGADPKYTQKVPDCE